MQMSFRRFRFFTALGAALLLAGGCCAIDEDRSDCDQDFGIDYELRLVTNMSTEIRTQLGMETDVAVAAALKEYLKDIFTDFAHDVDLSFYDVQGDSLRLHHESHIMDANQTSYALFLPVRRYMHTAIANLEDNRQAVLRDDDRCHPAKLRQETPDTIGIHGTGLFTARLPMDILEGTDQQFHVHLYMANCASALVLDPRQVATTQVKAFTTGFATGFSICDSLFRFSGKGPVVRTERVPVNDSPELCFCSVNFPSREKPQTKVVIETEDPFLAEAQEESLWEYHVYVTLPGGSITRSVLYLRKPLRAGQLKIIRGYLGGEGQVITEDHDVGVSVQLDWTPGMEFNPVL